MITDLNYAVEHQHSLTIVWHEPRTGLNITFGTLWEVTLKMSMTVHECIACARMTFRGLDYRPDIEVLADFVRVHWAQIYREDGEQ